MDTLENMDKVEKILCEKASLNKVPISGAIELLPLCNMNCGMCYIRLTKEEMEASYLLRSITQNLGPVETAESLIDLMKKTKNNREFVLTVPKLKSKKG